MNKQFGTRVLASEHTVSLATGIDLQRIGEVTARGQTRPVAVYEIVDLQSHPAAAHREC